MSYLTRIYERSRTYEFEIAFIANSLQTEFETLRTVSTLPPPTLAYPDFGIPFQIFTDASNYEIRAVLSQVQNNKEVFIAYFSRH